MARAIVYENGYYCGIDDRLYRSDSHCNTKGAAVGALVGGALGKQVGKGNGRTAAMVTGAVVGATVDANTGLNDENNYWDDRGSVRRCRTVVVNDNRDGNGWRRNGDSFNVTYRYANQVFDTVTNYDPGRDMRVIVDVRPYDTTHRWVRKRTQEGPARALLFLYVQWIGRTPGRLYNPKACGCSS